ncbi:MAG: glycosyltransferase [Pseudomonadota bacterium]|nr:glycosyltransferase [Pseudomonadota bacterium]
MSVTPPSVSVIVPMYNAENWIERCLAPLRAMLGRGEIFEIIVVNDGSNDGSQAIVRGLASVQLLAMDEQGGPAAARNRAAAVARGEYLWFVDSDVVVADNAAKVLRETLTRTRPAAVIGSYDDQPGANNFLSQYKNLVHHYYHHRNKNRASTFWAGCGAVQRSLFLQLGGFDAKRFRYPSIEDIELGYRIGDAGGIIVLDHHMQGKHLKEWRFVNLVHTEIFHRALPWSRLMLERKNITDDLNVAKSERLRAMLTGALLLSVLAWSLGAASGWVSFATIAVVIAANASFIAFFTRIRGPLFALRAFLFHQFYYFYSSATFAAAMCGHYFRRSERTAGGAS